MCNKNVSEYVGSVHLSIRVAGQLAPADFEARGRGPHWAGQSDTETNDHSRFGAI